MKTDFQNTLEDAKNGIEEIREEIQLLSDGTNEKLASINKNLITTSNNTFTSGTLEDILKSLNLSKKLTVFAVSNQVTGIPDGNGWYNMLVFNNTQERVIIAVNTWRPYHVYFTSFNFVSNDGFYLHEWTRLVEASEIEEIKNEIQEMKETMKVLSALSFNTALGSDYEMTASDFTKVGFYQIYTLKDTLINGVTKK